MSSPISSPTSSQLRGSPFNFTEVNMSPSSSRVQRAVHSSSEENRALRVIQRNWKQHHQNNLKKKAKTSAIAFNTLNIGKNISSLAGIEVKLETLSPETKEEETLQETLSPETKEEETLQETLSELLTQKKIREGVDALTSQLTNKRTIIKTEQLLNSINSLAMQIDPSFKKIDHNKQVVRSFLTAFMISKYPRMVIENQSSETELLESSSKELVAKLHQVTEKLQQPIEEHKGASYFLVFKEFYQSWNSYSQNLHKHQAKDKEALSEALTFQYLKIHAQREKVRYSVKSQQRELFDLEGSQLDNLRSKIKELKGEEGINQLNLRVEEYDSSQEHSILMRLSEERFLHEIATNPNFKLEPSRELPGIEAAIQKVKEGIEEETPNTTPLITLLRILSERVIEITPHRADLAGAIHSQIESVTLPLESGEPLNPEKLLEVITFTLSHLKTISNDELRIELDEWERNTSQSIEEGSSILKELPEALKVISYTTHKLSIELINYQTDTFRSAFVLKAAEKERLLFDEQLGDFEINLDKTWVVMKDSFAHASLFNLSPERFYTKNGAKYLSTVTALRLLMLQKKESEELCPETFMLDKETLADLNIKYQKARLSLFTLTFAEKIIKRALSEEEKQTLLFTVEGSLSSHRNPEEVFSQDLLFRFKQFSESSEHPLSKDNEQSILSTLLKAYYNKDNFLSSLDHSLGTALFSQITSGHLPSIYHARPNLKLIIPQLEKISTRLQPILAFNEAIHLERYQEILTEIAHDEIIEAVTQESPLTEQSCSRQYHSILPQLKEAKEQIAGITGMATGLSLIKSKIVSNYQWDVEYLVNEERFESLIDSSLLLEGKLTNKILEQKIVKLFLDECESIECDVPPSILLKMQLNMKYTWNKWSSAQLSEEAPSSIKPYASFIKDILCEKLHVEESDFEADHYRVKVATYLTHTWNAFCKTTVKEKSDSSLKEPEIQELVTTHQMNQLSVQPRKKRVYQLAALIRTTNELLIKRGIPFDDLKPFAIKLKEGFSYSHPGSSSYQTTLKKTLRKVLKNPSLLRSEESLPKGAKKIMFQFFTPSILSVLKTVQHSFVTARGTLFTKNDRDLIAIPSKLKSGIK